MMSKKMPLRLSLLLILALSIGRGEALGWVGSDDEKPFRLTATALDAPIGLIRGEMAGSDSLSINGRKAQGEQLVWNGDLLHSSAARRSEVALTSLGRLLMSRNTTVRIAASLPAESGDRRRLVATLISGEIAVQLEPGSDAYVEARGDIFRSSEGAEFRVQAQEGQPTAVATRGEVTAAGRASQRKYVMQPVGHGKEMKIYKGNLQQIRIQFTDERNNVLPEVPVVFTMGPPPGTLLGKLGEGTLAGTSFRTLTNAQGIAYVPFTAARKKGTVTITATAEDTGERWSGEIEIVSDNRAEKTGWIALAVGAAIAGGIAVYMLTRENDPIQTLPPTTPRP